jgi:hypothetical protein
MLLTNFTFEMRSSGLLFTVYFDLKSTETIVICVSRPKSTSFSSGRGAAEARKQARAKDTFWDRFTLNFLCDGTNYKAKDIIGKISCLQRRNYFFYSFQQICHINMHRSEPEASKIIKRMIISRSVKLSSVRCGRYLDGWPAGKVRSVVVSLSLVHYLT